VNEIRQATVKDGRGLAQVQVDSYRTAYTGLFPEPYLDRFSYEEQEQDWLDLLTGGMDDILLVAVSAEDRVIGYVLARAAPDLFPGYDAEILALHVRQSLQRKGIGKALLRRAVQELEARGCASVMLWTLKGNPVRRWYERLGGKVIGEKSHQVDNWDIVEIAYGWEKLSALRPGGPSAGAFQAPLQR
jgi:ribosomal protein S18 acetylase RimI-like enzyme